MDNLYGNILWIILVENHRLSNTPQPALAHVANCQGRENQIVVFWENCSHLRILYGQQINSLFKKEKYGT